MIFNKKYKYFSLLGLLFLVFIAFPIITSAATCPTCDSIVCCGNEGEDPCSLADLFCLVQRIINFILWQLVPPLIVIWFAYAGFLMLTSGGDPGKTKQAKDMITAAAIGIILVYSAWMLVYWFISFIGGPTQSNWLLQFFTTQTTP